MALAGDPLRRHCRGADTTAGPTPVAPRVEPVTEGGHMAEEQHDTIDDLSTELRRFPPPEGFKAEALVTGTDLYDEAAADDEGFWARRASELITWSKPWDTILEWELPYAKWFVGGELNVSLQLSRSARRGRPGRQGRLPLGGRARRQPHDHLRRAARRGAAVRQRAEGPRRRARATGSTSTCR